MSKITFDIKVSRLEARDEKAASLPIADATVPESDSVDEKYAGYKALVTGGKPKASEYLLEDLIGEATAADELQEKYLDGYDALAGEYFMCDDFNYKPTGEDVGDIPYVPKFEEEIKKISPGIDADQVLGRYVTLEKLIIGELRDTEATLQTVDQLEYIRAYEDRKKLLESALAECRTELALCKKAASREEAELNSQLEKDRLENS